MTVAAAKQALPHVEAADLLRVFALCVDLLYGGLTV
jgi:hypothetical protein